MKEENNNNQKKIYPVIHAVQAALAKVGISKDQTNAQQGYKFRGIDDVMNKLSPLLAEHKLLILPRMISRQCDKFTNQKGNIIFHVNVDAEYDFISVEDGSCHTVKMFGEAMDSSDKATNKAESAAYKYTVIQSFSVPIEGELDADSETHELSVPQQALPTRPAPKVPPRTVENQDSASQVWKGFIVHDKSKPYVGPIKSGPKAGQSYTLYRITLDTADGEKTATTFDEELGARLKGWDVLHEAVVRVAPNKRKEGTFEWLNLTMSEMSEGPGNQEQEDQPWGNE